MYNLEACGLVAPDCGSMSLVPGLSLSVGVLENDVRGLEDFDGEGVRFVLPNGLEQTRNEGRTDDLKLERLGVGDLDSSLVVVLVVQPFKVLFV